MAAKKPRWMREVDIVDEIMDEALEKIRKRDGRSTYEKASAELLSFFSNKISEMDGSPTRLIGLLRKLAVNHAATERYLVKTGQKFPGKSASEAAQQGSPR